MMNSKNVMLTMLFMGLLGVLAQAGTFSTIDWNSDADLPLSSAFNYTHAVDLANVDGTATIAGVTFEQKSVVAWADGPVTGADWSINGIQFTHPTLTASGPSGSDSGALMTGLAGGDAGNTGSNVHTIVLEGLTPNTDYIFTFFSPKWGDNVTRTGTLDGSDDGLDTGATLLVNQDNNQQALIIQYSYNSGSETTFTMQMTSDTSGNTLHTYSFTNEVAAEELPVIIEPVSPANGAASLKPSEVELTWQEKFTESTNLTFDVYLDPNETKVTNMDAATLVSDDQTAFNYFPSPMLDDAKTYYWRVVGYVDSVNDPNQTTDVWSFTTGYEVSHWDLVDWTEDADSQIALGKTYTHAVNFNADEASTTVVNGIVFENDSDQTGTNWTLDGAPDGYGGGTINVAGGGAALLSNFWYKGDGSTSTLTLTGLTPDENYVLTLYARGWDSSTGSRSTNVTTSDDVRTEYLAQDEIPFGEGRLFRFSYTAEASGELLVTFDNVNGTWLHYAFSNEVDGPYLVPTPGVGEAINYDDVLNWSFENSDVASRTYNVTVTTDPNLTENVQSASDLTAATFDPTLDPETDYYWQVEVEDGGVLVYTGPVWNFNTHPAGDAAKVLEWKFEDGLGATVEQTGSSDNADGVLVGFADPNNDLSMSVTGLVGQALELNGLSEYVDVSAAHPYMPTGDGQYFAVSGYFRTFGDFGPLFSMRKSGEATGPDDVPLIDIAMGTAGVDVVPGAICLTVRDDTGSIKFDTTTATFNDGRWHNFIVTRALDDWTLYVDGVEEIVLTNAATGAVTLDWLALGSSIRWQETDWGNGKYNQIWFDGQLDEYTVWSGILQSGQIETLASIVPPQGDIDFDLDTDVTDLNAMTQVWLDDSMTPVQVDVVLEDMESYTSDPNSYNMKWMPVEADDLGTTTLTPQVDPNDAGNTVMRMDFDFAGQQQIQSRFWLLEDRVDFAVFDQFKIRIKVLPATDADVFFMNIFDGRGLVDPANEDLYYKGQMQIDLTQVPVDQWVELVIEIREDFAGTGNGGPLTCHDLYRFTVAAYDEDSAGSGSVLIDTLALADATETCVVEVGALIPDFNGDCLVNLLDFAQLAENWMAGL